MRMQFWRDVVKSIGMVFQRDATSWDSGADLEFVGNTTKPPRGLGSLRHQQKGRYTRIPSETHNRCQGTLSSARILTRKILTYTER